MISRTTKRFRDALIRLPVQIQSQAKEAYQQFESDPYHPSLRFKKVHHQESIYSARINQDYRAVGLLQGDEIIWFWIGSHADYDKLLKQI